MALMNLTIILRLEMDKQKVSFGQISTIISNAGADMFAIDVIKEGPNSTVRDISVKIENEQIQHKLVEAINNLNGVTLKHVSDRTFLVHLGGKVEVTSKLTIDNREELSQVYTPEVARICNAINDDPTLAYNLTIKKNSVAVITDGSAVLGLGNIKPEAALPVMEGKAMLFKQLAGVNAYPICLNTQDTEDIIKIVKAMSPTFGGINLEDISSPRCFEIEERLKQELDIPVFHDDQHGTAIVTLAGLLNALKVTKKSLEACKIVVCGIGAAGIAITKMLLNAGAKNVIGVDKTGALSSKDTYENQTWNWYAKNTNPHNEQGTLSTVMKDADVFIGVSAPNILKVSDIKSMADNPIVFALANPDPEISPELAKPHVGVLATGRSDYPNQVNNVLCFPGIFRGVLDCRATSINEEIKLATAKAIAAVIPEDERNKDYIIPGVFNEKIVPNIREAVVEASYKTGVAKRKEV
ncbi:NAD-dependent malic enzyme [Aquibacillus sp. 3ASR75-11]|uniref:NAD-dependent malic enzyme n=1 Tax=Terrihalobacillus insolitus TaxID=2950438 RepID=A0A9X3WW21_9BACI|nr:NAD-dependent malic enzyme [Terrihalobacillus insolitus]MDC3414388.1 NAD-dependent malic enzyme [Terrihalobacillus insolitus]MDC3424469.1 NAD-dependent malic enzyme [Terrihalobacillus insolitus]